MRFEFSAKPSKRLFTTAEASALLDQPRARLQKWLSTKSPVTPRLERRGQREYRLIAERDLFYFAALSRLLPEVRLEVGTKQRLYQAVLSFLEEPAEDDQIRFTENLALCNASATFVQLQAAIGRLLRAEAAVKSDPQIRGGEPVLGGTRIPVQLVADLLLQGASVEEILEGYPRLTEELIELAAVYVAANPRQGRPRHPWH